MVYPPNPMSQRYFDSLKYKKEIKTIILLHNLHQTLDIFQQ